MNTPTSLSVLILFICQVAVVSSKESYKSSAFIQSASPTIVLNTGGKVQHVHNLKNKLPINNVAVANTHVITGIKPSFGAGVRHGTSSTSSLYAKKKKDSTVAKGGKIQVKLLKHVAGTGQAGDVIMVAPAFFTNKLQKTGSAVRISDEEVEKENAKQSLHDKEEKANAAVVKEKLENMEISLSKKAGPDGHLFGGVGYRTIMTELKHEFPQGCLDGKQVKITQIKNSEGKKLRGDIKEVGEYAVTVNLMKEISAALNLKVISE